ncbi:MAG: hypothetical protein OEV06_06915, partial [Anaerolineae bacterium]|nr:hypothetical protein [Anaerolineae bacterium]
MASDNYKGKPGGIPTQVDESIPLKKTTASLSKPFALDTKYGRQILVAFLMINAVVLYNALFHDPHIGYD